MNALGSVPYIVTHYVFHSEDVIFWYRRLALTQILGLAKNIRGHSLHVLNCLFNDHCFRESVFEALSMN